jgi:hypothetical protein
MFQILAWVGIILIGIGGCAGVGLLWKALFRPEIKNKDTLWGLFIVGVTSGLVLLGVCLSR